MPRKTEHKEEYLRGQYDFYKKLANKVYFAKRKYGITDEKIEETIERSKSSVYRITHPWKSEDNDGSCVYEVTAYDFILLCKLLNLNITDFLEDSRSPGDDVIFARFDVVLKSMSEIEKEVCSGLLEEYIRLRDQHNDFGMDTDKDSDYTESP